MQKKRFGTAQDDAGTKTPRSFSIYAGSESTVDLDEILQSVKSDPSNPARVPFPQANDLDKILDIIVSFREERKTSEQISKEFKFHGRQGDYYANSALYLGFLVRDQECIGSFVLTGRGKEIKRCKIRLCRNRILFNQLLRKPVFRSVMILLKDYDYDVSRITRDSVAAIIMDNYNSYSWMTCKRRASTVISWMKWINLNFKFRSD
jgi:hypothetical protein